MNSKNRKENNSNEFNLRDKEAFSSEIFGNTLFLVFLLLPLLYIRVAYISRFDQIDLNIPGEILPWIRIIFIITSIFNLGYPWFLKETQLKSLKITKDITLNSQWSIFIIGLFYIEAIAIFGLAIFFCGGSIPELIVFCLVSMISIIIWRIFRMPVENMIEYDQ